MKMKGRDVCMVWSQVPGLNEYWCQQIQWRIGIDDEVIAALTEPRYPCPNNNNTLETIILTQTVYLCQLFLHLQEFDPCAIGSNDNVPDDEFLRPFQDSLQREFNAAHAGHVRDGPAPDGEALERVVRGLMLAQREDSLTAALAPMTSPQAASPADQTKTQLQQVLASILRELNGPLHKSPLRYERAHGPRKDETWAARFATRIMQWRREMRTNPSWLVQEVIEVNRHDVCALDEEGLEVYRLVRNAAPGLIHLVTPLQPELVLQQPLPAGYYAQQPQQQHYQQQHQRSISGGMRVQQMLASPMARTPASTASGYSDTPRTTPQHPQQQRQGASSVAGGSMKRASQDPASVRAKRTRSMQSWEGEGEAEAEDEKEAEEGPGPGPGLGPGPRVSAESSRCRQIPVLGGPMEIDAPQQGAMTAAQETNMLLRRIVSGISELGQKMDAMQNDMAQRCTEMDNRLQVIQDWIGMAGDS